MDHYEFNVDDLWSIHVHCPICDTDLEHEELPVLTSNTMRVKAIVDAHNAEVHP